MSKVRSLKNNKNKNKIIVINFNYNIKKFKLKIYGSNSELKTIFRRYVFFHYKNIQLEN